MHAFQIERVSYFASARQNGRLCGRNVRNGIEYDEQRGPICPACDRIEREAWVTEWHQMYGVLGPIKPRDTLDRNTRLGTDLLAA